MLQALLERFEFFPVKCRVQRALEISQIELEKEQAGSTLQIIYKTKANVTFVNNGTRELSCILMYCITIHCVK
jgi:hypothetical protein